MAGITLAQAEAKLTLWMTAEEAIASNQSYEIEEPGGGRRKLTRADLAEVSRRISYWNNKVVQLSGVAAGTSRSRTIVN